MTIYFDMDGTIADFYSVPNWLDFLEKEDTTPYTIAKPLCNFSLLARYLNILKAKGYQIGIISWSSKESTAEFDELIRYAKKEWLKKHLPSVSFDVIEVVKYGTPKNNFLKEKDDILFDDVDTIRRDWRGLAYPPEMIFDVLRGLVKLQSLG